MKYELAKELKDAGFPQNEARPGGGYIEHQYQQDLRGAGCAPIYIPTLSELIESCGGNIVDGDELEKLLCYGENLWKAFSFNEEEGSGTTPEEAVARLWLALNRG